MSFSDSEALHGRKEPQLARSYSAPCRLLPNLDLETMTAEAVDLFKTGQQQAALDLAVDFCNNTEMLLGRTHPVYVNALATVAALAEQMGCGREAQQLLEEAEALHEEQEAASEVEDVAEDWGGSMSSESSRGDSDDESGDSTEAEAEGIEELTWEVKELLKDGHPELAAKLLAEAELGLLSERGSSTMQALKKAALHTLWAAVLEDIGEKDKAAKLYNEALSCLKVPQDHCSESSASAASTPRSQSVSQSSSPSAGSRAASCPPALPREAPSEASQPPSEDSSPCMADKPQCALPEGPQARPGRFFLTSRTPSPAMPPSAPGAAPSRASPDASPVADASPKVRAPSPAKAPARAIAAIAEPAAHKQAPPDRQAAQAPAPVAEAVPSSVAAPVIRPVSAETTAAKAGGAAPDAKPATPASTPDSALFSLTAAPAAPPGVESVSSSPTAPPRPTAKKRPPPLAPKAPGAVRVGGGFKLPAPPAKAPLGKAPRRAKAKAKQKAAADAVAESPEPEAVSAAEVGQQQHTLEGPAAEPPAPPEEVPLSAQVQRAMVTADHFLGMSKFERAADVLEEQLERISDESCPLCNSDLHVELLTKYGGILLWDGDLEGAVDAYAAADEVLSDRQAEKDPELMMRRAKLWSLVAQVHRRAGDLEAADRHLQAAVFSLQTLGCAASGSNDKSYSPVVLEDLLRDLHADLGQVCVQKKDYSRAQELYLLAFSPEPRTAVATM